ncbi:MAG TPA: long-chain fatty acid--CoA ligase [Acidimicrobiales bacterium]
MGELVALDLPAGPAFVDTLRAVWDAGDAALPVDPRLPRPAAERLLDALRPARVVAPDGSHPRPGGIPTEPGDALVIATSGTSGEPKGVVHTHASVTASAVATSAGLDVDPDRDRWVACLPLAHVGGLSVVTRSLVTGTPCTVLERFDTDALEEEARHGATLVSLVAAALGRCDASGYRAVLLGGAAPPTSLPPNVVSTYGMTETGSGCVYDGHPLDGVDLRIGDGTLGAEGEVLVRGPMLLRSYRDGTDPRLSGGWFPTGDGGRLEADGTLVVFGRMAEVVVTGAEKVWPVPVEDVVSTMDAVAEVAVWKRPDPEWGERVVAWVVLRPGAEAPALEQVRALVAAEIAPYAAPRELVVVDTLPRTPGGKVRRVDLV